MTQLTPYSCRTVMQMKLSTEWKSHGFPTKRWQTLPYICMTTKISSGPFTTAVSKISVCCFHAYNWNYPIKIKLFLSHCTVAFQCFIYWEYNYHWAYTEYNRNHPHSPSEQMGTFSGLGKKNLECLYLLRLNLSPLDTWYSAFTTQSSFPVYNERTKNDTRHELIKQKVLSAFIAFFVL